MDIVKKSPSAVDFEELVLGAMLLESDCIPSIMEILHKDCFYKPEHVLIFGAIESMFQRRDPINMATIVIELKRNNKLEKAGGPYYISTLTNRIASSSGVDYNAKIILQQYLKRKLISISVDTIDQAYDEGADVLNTLDEFIRSGKQLYDHITFGKMQSTDELLVELMADLTNKERRGLSSGIKTLDEYIVCLEPGLKYTIAGKPGMGKTSLAKTMVVNLINQGAPGIVFSMEVTELQFMTTVVSGICEIDSERIRKKELTPVEIQSIWDKMKGFRKDLLIIDGKTNLTESYILKRVKKAIKTHGIKWFMVDYTQLGKSDFKGRLKEERISEFTQGIKSIAKSENVIALELAQLKKEESAFAKSSNESKRPHISDIRDSGMIEASADCVILLYRPEVYGFKTVHGEDSQGLCEMIVAKNRQGKIGSALSYFMPQYTKFIDRQKIQYTPSTNHGMNEHAF